MWLCSVSRSCQRSQDCKLLSIFQLMSLSKLWTYANDLVGQRMSAQDLNNMCDPYYPEKKSHIEPQFVLIF